VSKALLACHRAKAYALHPRVHTIEPVSPPWAVFGRAVELHSLGAARGLATVVSSSFESSLGLAHLALLASLLGPPADQPRPPTCHGLGTASALARDVVPPGQGFGDLVEGGGGVDVLRCQALLDAFRR
jgi:hypothetical protein